MSALATLTVVEAKLFRRDGISLFFGLLFPPLLFVALGAFFPGFREPDANLGGLRLIDVYLPIVLALALASLSLSALPTYVATYRERGVLRRMATTPVGASSLLGAQLVVNVGVAVFAVALTMVIAAIGFGVDVGANPIGFFFAFTLTATAMFSIGLFIAAISSRASVATGIGMALYFPALFFAGVYFPRDGMPDALRAVSDATPTGSGVQAMQDALAGTWPQPFNLAILAAWIVVSGAAAVKLFKWQ
jgi:ABC-2 type transport system permease protein